MNKPADNNEKQSKRESKEDERLYIQSWVCFRLEFVVALCSFLRAMETLLHHDWERTQYSGDFKYPETLLQPLGKYLGPNHEVFLKLYDQMKKELARGEAKRFHRPLPPNTNVDYPTSTRD